MSKHVENLLTCKKVVFLQGPMGTFFNRVSTWLQTQYIETIKINFNGGDWFFNKTKDYHQCIDYTGKIEDFNIWFETLMLEQNIDGVICFGDCREYHQIAKHVTYNHNQNFFVFEEGYIRPHYITFESGGVNAHSRFEIDFSQIKSEADTAKPEKIQPANNNYNLMVCSAIIYFFMKIIMNPKYKHYIHHRNISSKKECISWIISAYRRMKNALIEPNKFTHFLSQHKQQYFVFPLQVHNDSQILVHSELKCMVRYIEFVIQSFSQYADQKKHLVIKHHPMDRGYRHYAKLLRQLSKQYGCEGRVHYYCDIHLPSLLKNSLGVVTVNSTTGIQALYHAVPVKVLGEAIYDIEGLSYQKDLSSFWNTEAKVNKLNFEYFKSKLIRASQLNGAYYGFFYIDLNDYLIKGVYEN